MQGPVVVRAINKVGGLLPQRAFTSERMMDKARRSTGLDDFGEGAFREGLDALIDALNTESRLNFIGHFAMHQQMLFALERRLRLQNWHKDNPQAAQSPIKRPLFVAGLPRSGTTLLSYLLDLDPTTRSLYQWEGADPVPPPELATWREDPRIEKARIAVERLEKLIPNMQAMHPMGATLPTECVLPLGDDFRSLAFDIFAHMPSYWAWREKADLSSAYRYHKRLLQCLQTPIPTETWVLKTPAHLEALPALFGVYPDATVIVTHRDLTKVMPSVAMLTYTLSQAMSNHATREQASSAWLSKLDCMLSRLVDYDAQGDGALYHLHYAELVVDPVAAVTKIYEATGREMTSLFAARIEAWMRDNAKGSRGTHGYALSDFDIEPDMIYDRYADYMDRFGVVKE